TFLCTFLHFCVRILYGFTSCYITDIIKFVVNLVMNLIEIIQNLKRGS
uniref:Uncharacterized protein n=1 Tax=Amphimedon queenslandica TaxID=400682 RepID=A0A1X7UF32_AMPQE